MIALDVQALRDRVHSAELVFLHRHALLPLGSTPELFLGKRLRRQRSAGNAHIGEEVGCQP